MTRVWFRQRALVLTQALIRSCALPPDASACGSSKMSDGEGQMEPYLGMIADQNVVCDCVLKPS